SWFGNFPSGPLSAGYWYDGEAPMALQDTGCDAVCASYRLHWVSGTTLPVPEPATYAMLLAGLGVLGAAMTGKRQR
ncbi:MAG TPA: PEP-CTERM sorting domain-containing protein, partial [Telluria sp.]